MDAPHFATPTHTLLREFMTLWKVVPHKKIAAVSDFSNLSDYFKFIEQK
jgi:hypothetical protein